MPATLAVHEKRYLAGSDLVVAASRGIVKSQRVLDCALAIARRDDGVFERVACCVFVIIQVAFRPYAVRAGIQCVDEHRCHVGGAGDLDAGL